MSTRPEKYVFGVKWHQFKIDEYKGYPSKMTDYHMHEYYEIGLIISGNV